MSSLRVSVPSVDRDDRRWILLVVALGWFVVIGVRLTIPVVLPDVRAQFGVGNAGAGLGVTLIWLTYALMQFPAGVLVDRLGERRVIGASLLIAAASLVAFSLTPLYVLFLAVCTMFGFGTGLFGPPRDTLIAETYREDDRTAFGIIFAAGSVGNSLLPVAVGIVALWIGWRTSLLALVPLFALTLVGVWLFVPRKSPDPGRLLDGSLRETAAEFRVRLGTRPILLAETAQTVLMFTFQGLTAFLPTYLLVTKPIGQGTATALYGSYFAVGAVVQLAVGPVSTRLGTRRTLVWGAVLSGLTLAALPFVDSFVALVVLVPALAVRSALGPLTISYLVGSLPDEGQGAGYGLLRTVYLTIAATGSVVIGLFGDAARFDLGFLFLAALTFGLVGIYALFPQQSE